MSWLLALVPGGNIAMSGLKFITSTFGAALLAAAIAFGVGYNMADGAADRERLQARIATLERDASITAGAERLAESQAGAIKADLARREKQLAALQALVAKRPANQACELGADDARALRRLR